MAKPAQPFQPCWLLLNKSEFSPACFKAGEKAKRLGGLFLKIFGKDGFEERSKRVSEKDGLFGKSDRRKSRRKLFLKIKYLSEGKFFNSKAV